ncbi:hypothetical protein [Piscirickettsia litoralis]|uniref:Uncharacterized protein n=1 Tax=Piscirickettsia litoralis TaxID=1891921 RepID=A0ABX3A330_9GAMM|nr:hypothetical protein [Piscirickettsia litoralis]ODN43286.1 hypothetical protein BGC07_10595 [Piscirickettsia litoralis]
MSKTFSTKCYHPASGGLPASEDWRVTRITTSFFSRSPSSDYVNIYYTSPIAAPGKGQNIAITCYAVSQEHKTPKEQFAEIS